MSAEGLDLQSLQPAGNTDAPRNQVRPTAVFILVFVGGLILDAWLLLPSPAVWLGEGGFWLGLAAALTGATLAGLCLTVFARLDTGIMPDRPSRRLVTFGPYRWSRNPMFVAFALLYGGGALILDSTLALALLPLAMAITTATVIRCEEAYLRSVFGDEYEDYARRVNRWLGRHRNPTL